MIKLLFVIIFIVIILFIFWQKNKVKGNNNKSNFYRIFLIAIIVLGCLFFLATSGKLILPQMMKIFKVILPLLTRIIGI